MEIDSLYWFSLSSDCASGSLEYDSSAFNNYPNENNESTEFLPKDDTENIEIPNEITNENAIEELNDNQLFEQDILFESLSDFKQENWELMSHDDKKDSITRFAECNADMMCLENKPGIKFYASDDKSDYGLYNVAENLIEINESNIADPEETLDTVAHESRHAYQNEIANDPFSSKGREFKENLDNYIDGNIDYQGYINQPIEVDAKEWAQNLRNLMSQ